MPLIRANWGKWAHIPNVELWQAVALSLDIDPTDGGLLRMLQHDPRSHSIVSTPSAVRVKFQDRLQVSIANLSFERGPLVPVRAYAGVLASPHAPIELAAFAAWAAGLPELFGSLPEQFPRGATVDPQSAQRVAGGAHTGTPDDPADPVEAPGLSAKARNTMLRLIVGMAIDHYGYDYKSPSKPSPTPREIEEMLTKLGLGLVVKEETIRGLLRDGCKLIDPPA
jgi:hypothetical protein